MLWIRAYPWTKKDGLNDAHGGDDGRGTRDPNQCRWGLKCDPSRADEDPGVEGSGCDAEVGIVGLGLSVSGPGPGRRSGVSGVLGR